MPWEPTFRPQLRPLEAFPVETEDGFQICVRDQSGLSDVVLTVSEPALRVLSLMDGATSCQEIRGKFQALFGQLLPVDTLQGMLEALDGAHFLEGPTFESHYQSLLQGYRGAGRREMPHAASLGIDEDSAALFDKMLDGIEADASDGLVRGLVAPHLDYARGEPCYAAAYSALRNHPAPARVVVLGTNHFGRSTSVVATGSDFVTPFGLTQIDVAFLERIEAQCGYLRDCELDHLREHSVELQVLWLQHLFGADSFVLVPFLCPDPCGPTGTAPADSQGVDLGEFVRVLGELIAEDDLTTLVVAGADLSHVGAAFGDERPLDDGFLDEVRRRDIGVLDELTTTDPEAVVRRVARDDNVTRVCSMGCIFALAGALPGTTRTVLKYHQAVDEASQTCVTCAAVVFT